MDKEKESQKLKNQLKKTRNDLEDLEAYVQDMLFFVPVGFCFLSGIGKIVDSNQRFRELIGYNIMELSGNSLYKFFVEREKIRKILKEIIKTSKIKREEVVLVRKDGKKIPVSLSVSARREEKGELIGCFVGITDISELKELQLSLEERVRQRTEELQERIDELEKFRKLTEGREIKMAGLKEENKKLREKIKNL